MRIASYPHGVNLRYDFTKSRKAGFSCFQADRDLQKVRMAMGFKNAIKWGCWIGIANLIWLYAAYYLGLHTTTMNAFQPLSSHSAGCDPNSVSPGDFARECAPVS